MTKLVNFECDFNLKQIGLFVNTTNDNCENTIISYRYFKKLTDIHNY